MGGPSKVNVAVFPGEEPAGPLPRKARAQPWPSGDRTGVGLGARLNRQISAEPMLGSFLPHFSSLLPAFPREQTLCSGLEVGRGRGQLMLTSDGTGTPTVLQRNLHPTSPFFSSKSKTLLTWYLVTQAAEPQEFWAPVAGLQGAPFCARRWKPPPPARSSFCLRSPKTGCSQLLSQPLLFYVLVEDTYFW